MSARPSSGSLTIALTGAVIVAASSFGLIGWSAAGRWLETGVAFITLSIGLVVIRGAR